MKKPIVLLMAYLTPFIFFAPAAASALTAGSAQAQMQSLMQQLVQLQQRLANLEASRSATTSGAATSGCACPARGSCNCPTQIVSSPSWCSAYQDLTFGDTGAKVIALQTAMGSDLGSVPSGYYGSMTRALWRLRCGLGSGYFATTTQGVASAPGTTRTSCLFAGGTYSSGSTIRACDLGTNGSPSGCPAGLVVMGSPLSAFQCVDGQWIRASSESSNTSASNTAATSSGGSSNAGNACVTPVSGKAYANGIIIPFVSSDWCSMSHPCAAGLVVESFVVCKNGSWVAW